MVKKEKLENMLIINSISKLKVNKIKIKKTEDYYNIFKYLLKGEDKILHSKEHVWIMGIDEAGYTVCVYIVALGKKNALDIHPSELFKISLIKESVKIVLAHNHPDKRKIEPSEEDIFFTNKVYHQASIVGIELLDHIILSLESIRSESPVYYSFKESGLIQMINEDISYIPYVKLKEKIDGERFDYGEQMREKGEAMGIELGEQSKAIEVAKGMFKYNESINKIIEYTGLTKSEIKKIKNDDL